MMALAPLAAAAGNIHFLHYLKKTRSSLIDWQALTFCKQGPKKGQTCCHCLAVIAS